MDVRNTLNTLSTLYMFNVLFFKIKEAPTAWLNAVGAMDNLALLRRERRHGNRAACISAHNIKHCGRCAIRIQ